MSDYNSSLPVRTETAGDVIVKLADATVTSQQLAINADGSVNITDNGGSLTVDGTVAVTATDFDIRDLSAAQDNVAISDGTDTLEINGDGSINITDNGGSITVDGTVTVTATDLDIRNLVFATDKVDVSGSSVALDAGTLAALESITVQNPSGAGAVNIQDGGNSITVDGSVTVTATDLDIRDLSHTQDSVKIGDGTDFLAVNTDGSINVVIADATPGTPINSYNTSAALAAAGSNNHDYTVTAAKTLYLNQIEATASGKAKIEVQIETAVASGTFNTRFVEFNSTATPNMQIHLDNPIAVAAGVRVRVIRTNKDNQSQDVYSTICGYELP